MTGADWANAENAARQGVLFVLGGVLALVGLIFTWLRHRRDEYLSKIEADRHWTHRYTDAVAQLGSDAMAIKLGGIYALERLTQDAPSDSDRQTIAEVFAAYLREYSPVQPGADFDEGGPGTMDPICKGVAEALGRVVAEPLPRPLNLSHVNLSEASFVNASLEHWNFRNCWMWRSDFSFANLNEARLQGTVLNQSSLRSARLTDAIAHDSRMEGADLSYANLKGAELSRSRLNYAFTEGTKFEGTNMLWTDLSDISYVDESQLARIGGWDERTVWPKGYEPPEAARHLDGHPPMHD